LGGPSEAEKRNFRAGYPAAIGCGASSAGAASHPGATDAAEHDGDLAGHTRDDAVELLEVPQVRLRLSLADRHEQAIGADDVIFLADLDVLVVVDAIVLEPDRLAATLIASGDRPGPRQGMVEGGDLGLQDVQIGAIEIVALLERRLIILELRSCGIGPNLQQISINWDQ
jgi:hypothetical protein